MSDSSNFMPHGDMLKGLEQAHTGAVAQWDKTKSATAMLDNMREQLDRLVALGDMVSSEDVLDAVTELVASGASAPTMAGLLADMPPDGPSLQQWILQQDQKVEQMEQAAEQQSKLAQHNVAVTGLHVLHAYGTLGEPAAQQQQGGPGNALAGPQAAVSPAAGAPPNPLNGAA